MSWSEALVWGRLRLNRATGDPLKECAMLLDRALCLNRATGYGELEMETMLV